MEVDNNNSSSLIKIILAIVGVLVCCVCVLMVAAGAWFYQQYQTLPSDFPPQFFPTAVSNTPAPVPTLDRTPVVGISSETLETLNKTLVPENDPYDLACRLQGLCNIPKTVQGKSYTLGDTEKFWILNSDTTSYNQITATLLYSTPHTYFWAENGVDVNKSDMKALMDTFEAKIYPTDREFFGSEWSPGVDNDPHIFVIYAGGLGSNIAGGFDSTDEYNPQVKENSNGHETFILSSTEDLAYEYTYTTLAHEFVHMIQFPTDRNDASWMVEGFADVGAFLNGYYVGGADWMYAANPDLQLNTWVDNQSPDFGPHYGQSFLFLAYFLDRFGKDATKYLNSNPLDDLASIDDTLAHFNSLDPQTGKPLTADDVFMDWAAALYLKNANVGDGRYTYHDYPNAPQTADTDTISFCPQTPLDRSVNQYGIDYIKVNCTGDYTLHFTGSTTSGLLPAEAHSGKYAFWSNKGNESDMTLTREFDFTDTSGPITFNYWTWFDIEKDWDYLYVEASTDGQSWQILKTPSGTGYNPSNQSYGWAYTGQTNDWIQEQIDLSQYAGQKVQIRFEYITDAAINGGGFLLDDVQVDAINYQSDFEADDGGWVAAGFVRVQNTLPQVYRLSLILKSDTTTVTSVTLNADNTADIPLSLKSGEEATLIVSGMMRYTNQSAAYQIEIK